jgi:hypothetical protein
MLLCAVLCVYRTGQDKALREAVTIHRNVKGGNDDILKNKNFFFVCLRKSSHGLFFL